MICSSCLSLAESPACSCGTPLCASREQQMERLQREVHELRLALAESLPTVEARRDLEAVNARLAESNRKVAALEARLYGRKK